MAIQERRDAFGIASQANQTIQVSAGQVNTPQFHEIRAFTAPAGGIVGPVEQVDAGLRITAAGAYTVTAQVSLDVVTTAAGEWGVSLLRTNGETGAGEVIHDSAIQSQHIGVGGADQDFIHSLEFPLSEFAVGDVLYVAISAVLKSAGALTFNLSPAPTVSTVVVRRFDITSQEGETVDDVFRLGHGTTLADDDVVVVQPPGGGVVPLTLTGALLKQAVRESGGALAIPAGSVGLEQLAPDARPSSGSVAIPDGSITDRKVAANAAISGQKIGRGSITRDRMTPDAQVDSNFVVGATDPIPSGRIARGERTTGYAPLVQPDGELTFAALPAGGGGGGGQSAAQVSEQIKDEAVGVVDSLPASGYATGDAVFASDEKRIFEVQSIQGAQAFDITAESPGGGDDRVGYYPGSFGASDDAPAWVSRLYWDDGDQRLKLRIRALSNPVSVRVRWGTHGTANLTGALAGGFWSGSAPFTSPPSGNQPITITPDTAFGAWVPVAAGARGPAGPQGPQGDPGAPGEDGNPGSDASVTRASVYPQAKAILREGSNITITADDAAETLTVAGQAGGGGGVSQSEATAIAHAAVAAGTADWAEANNTARIPQAKMSSETAEIDGYLDEGGWADQDAVSIAQTTWAAQPTASQLTGAAYQSTYTATGGALSNRWVGIRVAAAQADETLRAAVTALVHVIQTYERHDAADWTEITTTGGNTYYAVQFAHIGFDEQVRAQSHTARRWKPGLIQRAAADVSVDASGFDGNLSSTDTNLQLVAQRLDDLVVSGGGGGGGAATPLYEKIGETTIVQRGPRWQFQSPLTASPVIPDDLDFFVIEIDGERASPTANWDHVSIFVTVEAATFRNLPASVGGVTSINGNAAGVDGTAAFGNYRFINRTPQEIWGDRISIGRTAANGLVFASNDAAADTNQQFRFKVFRVNSVGGGGAAAQPAAGATLPVSPEDDERALLTADAVWRQDYAVTWNAEATNLVVSATPTGAEAIRWYSADSGNPVALRSRVAIQDSTTDARTPAALWVDGVRYAAARASQALQHFYLVDASLPNPSAGQADRINVEFTDGSFSRSQDVSSGLVQYDATADSWAHVPGQWTLPQIDARIAPWAHAGEPAPISVLHDGLVALNIADTTTARFGNWTRFSTNLAVPASGQGVLSFDLYFNDWATSASVQAVSDSDRLAASAITLGRLRGLAANSGTVVVGLLPVRNAAGAEIGVMAIQVRRTSGSNVEFRTAWTPGSIASTGANFAGNAWMSVSLQRAA